jgi:hypothetical protein
LENILNKKKSYNEPYTGRKEGRKEEKKQDNIETP